MGKNTVTENYLTGTGDKISPANSFLYEISYYKVYKDRFECIGSKYISSVNRLNIKKSCKIKKNKLCNLCVYIDWVGAPIEYIKEQNFELIIPKTKKK